jgi:mono/diheme cytochrome c family protein
MTFARAGGTAGRALSAFAVGLLACAAWGIASGASAGEAPGAAYPQGATSFQANCAVCHGPAGAGVPALAPPLLSYPASYAVNTEGRRQLVMTVLYGLFGAITVGDQRYDSRMPDFARLDDATLAATLNFVVFDLAHAPAGVSPLAAGDIAAERAHALDAGAVREHRKSVAPP